jgi:hypothetical protein
MNSLINLINAHLSYERGKQTGIPGVIGIIGTIGILYYWERIYPFLDFLAIPSLFKNLGLVGETPLGTIGYILAACLTLSIITVGLFLVAGIALLGVGLISNISQSSKSKPFINFFIQLFLFPFRLFFSVLTLLKVKDRNEYEQAKRYKVNKEEFDFLCYNGIYKSKAEWKRALKENGGMPITNEISKEEALTFLNRLPAPPASKGLTRVSFLVASTFDRKFYILFPTPTVAMEKMLKSGMVYAHRFTLDEPFIDQGLRNYKKITYGDYDVMTTIPVSAIECYFKVEHLPLFSNSIHGMFGGGNSLLRTPRESRSSREYAGIVNSSYLYYAQVMTELIQQMNAAKDLGTKSYLKNKIELAKATNHEAADLMIRRHLKVGAEKQ